MIGIEDLRPAGGDLGGASVQIAWNDHPLADLRDRGRHPGVPIAIDHQPRIVLRDQRRIERLGHAARQPERSDIPGDVPVQFGRRQSQISKAPRNPRAGMIDHDDEIRPAVPALLEHGGRLVGGQESEVADVGHG